MLLFPPYLVQLLLQHVFKKCGLRDHRWSNLMGKARSRILLSQEAEKGGEKLAHFIGDQHGDLSLGEHPKTTRKDCCPHREHPTSQPTSCITYGSRTTQPRDVALRKWSMGRNQITVIKKHSTCGWSYFLRWISKMTAYLLKIMNSLVLLVREGTQGEKLYVAAAVFK